jgi:hypothetical protein
VDIMSGIWPVGSGERGGVRAGGLVKALLAGMMLVVILTPVAEAQRGPGRGAIPAAGARASGAGGRGRVCARWAPGDRGDQPR